jgi:hypothetical protein
MINSTNYTDDNDLTDGGPGTSLTPGFPSMTTSVRGTDGREGSERDLALRRGGLPLANNYARAHRDPARDQRSPAPELAVPNNVITKVQVRYYNECGTPMLSTRDLAPLPAPTVRRRSHGGTPGAAERGRPHCRHSNLSFNSWYWTTWWGLPAGWRRGAAREPRRDRPTSRAPPLHREVRLLHRLRRSSPTTATRTLAAAHNVAHSGCRAGDATSPLPLGRTTAVRVRPRSTGARATIPTTCQQLPVSATTPAPGLRPERGLASSGGRHAAPGQPGRDLAHG